MQRTVRDLMNQLELTQFPVVTPLTSVGHAASLMSTMGIGAALIMEDRWIKGVFTERDFLQRASIHSDLDLTVPVQFYMNPMVVYVTPNCTLEECMMVMSDMGVRYLPVLDHDYPVAIVSQDHITEALVGEKEHMISQLHRYITGLGCTHYERSPGVTVRKLGA